MKRLLSKLSMPHQYVTLALITLLMVILTYVVPAGNFERRVVLVNGIERSIVIPGTYEESSDKSPVGFLAMMLAPYNGLIQAASIVFFTMLVCPSFYLVVKTGALDGFIAMLIKIVGTKAWLIIPFFTTLFGLGGSMIVSGAEFYGFIPILAGLTVAFGYDAFVGFAIVVLGTYTGFAAATTNPFNIAIAQGIAEIPIYSGLGVRFVIFILHMTIIIIWLMAYASKVKKNPETSLVKGLDLHLFDIDRSNLDKYKITTRHWCVFTIFLGSMIILIFGAIVYQWGLSHIVGLFLTMGLSSAFIMGWSPNKVADEFISSMSSIASCAVIAGVSRGILVVLDQGNIIDTIMNTFASSLEHLPSWLTAVGMLFTQTIINFFIPSGSGQAMTTMPIMVGISDLLGISRQVTVTAFHFGDGLSNILWPTCGTAIVCGIIGIPMQRWWKFYVPLFCTLLGLQTLIIIVLSLINFS